VNKAGLASLLLAAVHPKDRTWLISHLPEGQRNRLVNDVPVSLPHLSIEEVRQMLADIERESDAPRGIAAKAGPTDGSLDGMMELVDAANPDDVAGLLETSPVWFVHSILGLRSWRWTSEIQRRRNLEPRLSVPQSPPTPKVIEALMDAMTRELSKVSKSDALSAAIRRSEEVA
jgi:hypothetical protein